MKTYFASILILLYLTCPVLADQPLTIVRGQNFPPYHFMDKTGQETGFLIDIILQVSASMDLSITFEQYPWSRCLRMVKTGEADAMMNLFKTKERVTFMYFADNVLAREVNRFFKLKTNKFTFTGNLTQMKGKRLGTIRNYSYGKEFDAFRQELTLLELETEKALILNLIGRRCDIILGNEIVLQSLSQVTRGGDAVVPTGAGITNDPLYIGFSKARKHKTLAERFSKALKKFKAGPGYREIIKKYNL